MVKWIQMSVSDDHGIFIRMIIGMKDDCRMLIDAYSIIIRVIIGLG